MSEIIIIFLIIVLVNWQVYIYNKNKINILLLKEIFPYNPYEDLDFLENETSIMIKKTNINEVFEVIVSSLNNYLRKNKSAVSDYHLMKDIVERNCSTLEDEIHTQIPVPVYIGLAGTMLGILFGIGFFVISGGLNALLNIESGSGLTGIETLLGGVALAMISSISGITLTTIGSQQTKKSKAELEKNKNTFLSWIQAELLPNISSDTSSALVRMTENLSNFNATFSQNTNTFKNILIHVTESYQKQIELMQKIDTLKINEIASANIDVYEKLKNSTDEIGKFAEYLEASNTYLETIQSLNKKLDDYEKRTQVIENAGNFYFKNERWLAENINNANDSVQKAIKRFDENTNEHLLRLQESLNGQTSSLYDVVSSQQEKLAENINNANDSVQNAIMRFDGNTKEHLLRLQESLNGQTSSLDGVVRSQHEKLAVNINNANDSVQNAIMRFDDLTKEHFSKLQESLSGQTSSLVGVVLIQQQKLAENIDKTNLDLQKALARFDENTKEKLLILQDSLNGQILSFGSVLQTQHSKLENNLINTTEIFIKSFTNTHQTFEKAITEQQIAYQNKLNEFSKIAEEIKNLTHIKEGIKDFKEATNRQNQKIEELTKEISALAKAKIEGGTIKQMIGLPKWIKALIIASSSIAILLCLFIIIPLLIELIAELINWLF